MKCLGQLWKRNKTGVAMSEKVVDYIDLVSRYDAEERASRGEQVVLPEPAGEQVVDYLAVSKAWKEERGWMDNWQNEMRR